MKNIKILSLGSNKFKQEGARYIFDALKSLKNIKEICLEDASLNYIDKNLFGNDKEFKKICLINNNFTERFPEEFCFSNRSLVELNLGNCRTLLSSCIEQDNLFSNNLSYLDISGTTLKGEFGKNLIKKISKLQNLITLILINCQIDITSRSFNDLLLSLKKLTSLKRLNLSENNLRPNGIVRLKRELNSHQLLKIHLKKCNLESVIDFSGSLFHSLKTIDVSNNCLTNILLPNQLHNNPNEKLEIFINFCLKNKTYDFLETNQRKMMNVITLDISSNNLKTTMGKILPLLKNHSKKLERIYIFDNGLDTDYLIPMIDNILEMKNLKVLNNERNIQNHLFRDPIHDSEFLYIKALQFIDSKIFSLAILRKFGSFIDKILLNDTLKINEEKTPSKYLKYFLNIFKNTKFEISNLDISKMCFHDDQLKILSQISYSKNSPISISITDVKFSKITMLDENLNFLQEIPNINSIFFSNISIIENYDSEGHSVNLLSNFLKKLESNENLSLKSIHISCANYTLSENLCVIIGKPYLTKLYIDFAHLSENLLKYISEKCKVLLEISFWGCKILSSKYLIDILAKNNKLSVLQLGECENLTKEDVEKILKTLTQDRASNLKFLGLRRLSVPGRSLVLFLRNNNEIEILDLGHCFIADLNFKLIVDILVETGGRLKNNLESLSVKGNLLRDLPNSLEDMFKTLKALKVLSFSDNRLQNDLTVLLIENLKLHCKKLGKLFLNNCNIQYENGGKIGECIMELKELKFLSLSDNKFGKSIKNILDSLQNLKDLLYFNCKSCFKEDDFENDEYLLETLKCCFKENSRLTFLDFSENPIGDKLGKNLLNQLSINNKQLKTLALRRCKFTGKLCEIIENLLKCLQKLNIFDISENKIDTKIGKIILRTSHLFCKNMSVINLTETGLCDDLLNEVILYVNNKQKLEILCLEKNNNFSDKIWQSIYENLNPNINIPFLIKFNNQDNQLYCEKLFNLMDKIFKNEIKCFNETPLFDSYGNF